MALEKKVEIEAFRFTPSDRFFLNDGWTYVNLPEGSDRSFKVRGTVKVNSGRCYFIDFYTQSHKKILE